MSAWPDPAQPGVPLNPERDGYHWLRRKGGGLDPWAWEADQGGPGLGGWVEEGGDGTPADFERAFTYHAPCTPSDREALRLVLVMAPSFQGGHSGTGGEVADFLGIPFPVRMPALAEVARARGFDPNELWPWWAKQMAERAEAERAEAASHA